MQKGKNISLYMENNVNYCGRLAFILNCCI